MVTQLSGVQLSKWQLEGCLVLDRLVLWLDVSLGGNVLGCVATKLGSGPLRKSINLDTNDKSISIETS